VQVLLILFGALFTVAVCLACGRLLLRDAVIDPGIRFVCGAAVLSLAVFAALAAGAAYPTVFLLLGAAVLWSARHLASRSPANSKRARRGPVFYAFVALLLAYFAVYFIHAMAPEISPDGTAYHLSLVSRYLREHGFHRITTNMYASLSQGVEMLFLFAFAFGKHSAAALVHLAFLLALAWQMVAYGRRAGFPFVAACAAFLVLASPVVGIDAASAYNDVAVAAIAFTVFQLLELWDSGREARLLVAIGLVAGFAYAAKYTAALAVPYAIGYVGWKSQRRWRDMAIVAAWAALLVAPWMIKNWLWVHNPVSPFFNQLFKNQYVSTDFEAEYSEYLRHYELSSLRELPMQVTTYGKLSGLLGPVFLLTPIALVAAFRREGRRLLLAGLIFGAPYFLNVGTRFLIPPLPFIALAMALALCSVRGSVGRGILAAVVLVHAYLSWPSRVPKYGKDDAWRLRGIPWREALRIRSEDGYLARWVANYDAVRLIEGLTPPGSTVFTGAPIPEAYTSRRVLVEYQATENQITGRTLRVGALPEGAPTSRLHFSFARQPLRAIRIVQTANPVGPGTALWKIHEVRIFDGERELPRRPGWRLRARPYAWGIQNAFDNSPVTFWLSGDRLRPGMYVQVEFGREEDSDALDIETTPDQWQTRLMLEGQAASGEWNSLASAPELTEEARPLGLRRAVARELKRRGIDYLLLFDEDNGADDLRRNTEQWGVRLVGTAKGARLYQLP
jgi:4-amino-4-deoxy-L-arabinose transferase-like glycosyltransferase